MKSISFCFILIIAYYVSLFSQAKHDYIWMSGYGLLDPDPEFGISFMDFNNNNLTLYEKSLNIEFNVTDISVCNEAGQLIFYSNGCFVFNKEHKMMLNGDSLNYNEDWFIYCEFNDPYKYYLVNKGIIVLPKPGNSYIYYLFSNPKTVYPSPQNATSDALYASIIDMSLDNGLGGVTEKNIPVVNDFLFIGDLTAVKHANGEDWWVVVPRRGSNVYHRVLLTADGITSVDTQAVGMEVSFYGTGSGQAVFSPDGTKYARYNEKSQVILYDFDGQSGLLSNYRQFTIRDTASLGGIAFSPNNRFLYVSSLFELYQFDLAAPDIQASKVLIASWDGFRILGIPTLFFNMQLGPDCRIYMIAPNSVPYLHVIHHPDYPGTACGFEQHGLRLPTWNAFSQPNFPNYRLGTPYPVCDSSIVLSGGPGIFQPVEAVKVYPNPAVEEVHLEFALPPAKAGEWVLYDAFGRAALREKVLPGQQAYTFSLAGLPPGLYFWTGIVEGRNAESGKLIISK